jgi:hypothetical protein
MISTEELSQNLSDRIYNVASIGEIRQVIDDLRQRGIPEVESDRRVDLLSLAFSSARRLTAGSPRQAESLIIERLLPLCFRPREEGSNGKKPNPFPWILRSWLDELPEKDSFAIRRQVLSIVRDELELLSIREACVLIDVIAYRERFIVRALRGLLRTHNDEMGDLVLATLVKLGVPPRHREKLIAELLRRIKVRWKDPLSATAKGLPDVRVLETICKHWLNPERLKSEEEANSWLPRVSIPIIAMMADTLPADISLQYLAWKRLYSLRETIPQLFESILLYDTRFTLIDSPEVVRFHLRSLGKEEPAARYLSYTRLEECVRPHQLDGWVGAAAKGTLDVLHEDACMVTGMEGIYSTRGFRQKSQAWNVLLSLGRKHRPSFDRALQGEGNGFAISETLEIAACLRNDPLPSIVVRLLANPFGEIPDEENQRLAAHVSAIHVAHSACSEEALQALLAFEPVTKGGVLLSLIKALADITAALNRKGITSPLNELWRSSAVGNPPHRRAAAAAAIAQLVASEDIKVDDAPAVLELAQDSQLDPYARRNLLEAIGRFPRGSLAPDILQEIRQLAKGFPKSESGSNGVQEMQDLAGIALGVLARQGMLADDADQLQSRLGLRRASDTWEFDDKVRYARIVAHVVGVLFADDPERFAPAVAHLLRTDDLDALYLLAPGIRRVGRSVPSIVVDALLDRVREMNLGSISESDVLPLIALVCPNRLVSIVHDETANWIPDARSDLANALAETGPLNADMTERRADFILRLMGDGQFRVRRSAYRAMAKIDHLMLRNICISWASIRRSVDARKRAAEASGWLLADRYPLPIRRLAWDPEPSVREAFVRSQSERRERLFAEEYMEHVLSVQQPEQVVPAWRYGEAVARTGDDHSLAILEKRVSEPGFQPSIRYWLHRIRENLKKRWDRVVEKWPESSYAHPGRLEVVNGTLIDEKQREQSFEGCLWYAPTEEITGVCSWGGWTESAAIPQGEYTIKIPGRREARLFISRTVHPDGPSMFWGNGPFPSPISQEH